MQYLQANSAQLQILARRLRYLRRFPPDNAGRTVDKQSASLAYEYALRVLINEITGGSENFHALFYGPQGEDPDRCDRPD